MPDVTKEVEVTIDIEVWCDCGEGLCNQSVTERHGRGIVVTPCEKCMEVEYERGRGDGIIEAKEDE